MDFPWHHINQHLLETTGLFSSILGCFHTKRHDPSGSAELDNSIFKGEINHGVNTSKPPPRPPPPNGHKCYQINTLLRQRLSTSWNSLSFLNTLTTVHPPLRSCPSAARQWRACKPNWWACFLLTSIPGPLRSSAKGLLPGIEPGSPSFQGKLVPNTLAHLCYPPLGLHATLRPEENQK